MFKPAVSLAASLILAGITRVCFADPNVAPAGALKWEETYLHRLPPRSVAVVPDASFTRIAFVIDDGNGRHVVLGGVAGEHYRMIAADTLTFSPDGKHLAYSAAGGARGGWGVVVDGVHSGEYDTAPAALTFSPDGTRLAYAAFARGSPVSRWAVIVRRVGGAVEREFDTMLPPGPDPKRRRPAPAGVSGPGYDRVDRVAFTPDGNAIGYRASRGSDAHWIIDGVRDDDSAPAPGPFVPRNGPVRLATLTFSDDPHTAACVVMNDTMEGQLYRTIRNPIFSRNGKFVAYYGIDPSDDKDHPFDERTYFCVNNSRRRKRPGESQLEHATLSDTGELRGLITRATPGGGADLLLVTARP